jgi:homoserine dehydrogenase
MFYGSGAGKLPTASAVVADLVDAIKHLHTNVIMHWYSKEMELLPIEEVPTQMFVVLKNHGHQDAIEDVFGKVTYLYNEDETVFITEHSNEGKMALAFQKLEANYQLKPVSKIRIESGSL